MGSLVRSLTSKFEDIWEVGRSNIDAGLHKRGRLHHKSKFRTQFSRRHLIVNIAHLNLLQNPKWFHYFEAYYLVKQTFYATVANCFHLTIICASFSVYFHIHHYGKYANNIGFLNPRY